MNKSNRSAHTLTNQSGRSKHHVTLKDFNALSFEVLVRGDSFPTAAINQSEPRLTSDPAADRPGYRRSPADLKAPDDDPSESGRAMVQSTRTKTALARVLIADDTLSVRESLAKALRAEGYEIEVAANGREALEKFDPERIDLVLMDLDMPVSNGWDALEQLMATYPDQAVIIITGKAEPCRWAEVGRSKVLVEKPIDLTVLLESIRHALTESPPDRKERIAVQHKLTRHTRPLTDRFAWQGYRHGGLNE